jgi:RNA polymerase sigma-70 factor (ECF subfamily)
VIDVEALYTKYGPMVMRRCRSILKDEEMALDAMQDVFIKVLSKMDKLHQRAPSSLLYTMATNHCLNVLRDRRETGGWDPSWFENIPHREDFEGAVIDRMTLDAVFREHQESTRLIAWLHYLDGMTLEETADFVGMSVSGIRKRLRKLKETGGKIRGESA